MLVTEVYNKTKAQDAGLQPGDLVLSINGVNIEDKSHYLQLLRSYVQGQKLKLHVLRREKPMDITVEAGGFESKRALTLAAERWGFTPGPRALRRGGLTVDKVLQRLSGAQPGTGSPVTCSWQSTISACRRRRISCTPCRITAWTTNLLMLVAPWRPHPTMFACPCEFMGRKNLFEGKTSLKRGSSPRATPFQNFNRAL